LTHIADELVQNGRIVDGRPFHLRRIDLSGPSIEKSLRGAFS
jgi:hypothetical protein